MLSKPIASGAMLAVLLGAVGAAALQPEDGPTEAAVTQIETAETAPVPEPEPVVESEPVEETAVAPSRVVDTAGFPVVPEDEAEEEPEVRPIVTVDGRPLGEASVSEDEPVIADEATEAPETDAPATVVVDEPEVTEDSEAVEVAVVEPPRPLPRPDNLVSTETVGGIDYDAIATAAEQQPAEEFMTPEERRSIVTLSDNSGVDQPNDDGLVQIVGPSGQIIWVYADQLEANSSRVTVQRPQPRNPYGFVYD